MDTPGKRLRAAREKAGYQSARAAALNINVPISTYNSHERAGEPGARKFNPDEAERYARNFRVSAEWLLFGRDESGAPPSVATPTVLAPKGIKLATPPNASAPREVPRLSDVKIPVYGRAVGGDEGKFIFNGERMGDVFCPPILEGVANAYAVEVYGESMWPRLKPGETVWVNPNRPIHKGDDVVVQMHPTEEGGDVEGYIKEYVTMTPTMLILLQHNPKMEIEIDRTAVMTIHKVVFQQRL